MANFSTRFVLDSARLTREPPANLPALAAVPNAYPAPALAAPSAFNTLALFEADAFEAAAAPPPPPPPALPPPPPPTLPLPEVPSPLPPHGAPGLELAF